MEGFIDKIEEELRSSFRTSFIEPYLYEQAIACMLDKQQESMILSKMTVLHYRMFGGEGDQIYLAAAAVELMILGLDMIDDLQDQDNKGKVWNQLEPAIALNIAIGMLTLSQKMLLTSSFPLEWRHEATELMCQQTLTAINGQTTDILNSIENEEDYIRMVEQKSAALLVSACMIGALLATGKQDPLVRGYAEELGIAAQIKNDIHDLVNWENKNDFLNRKKTLPTLFLLQSLSEKDEWVNDYFEGHLQLEDVIDRKEEIELLIEKTGTLLYTSVRMRTHYYKYLNLIEQLRMAPYWKDQMLALAE
ncbi:polyprenyl synthetase family protein [Paenibacillus sp. IHBB 10380]|uniref:polyprenyl synthetase family protein n=1 Tax=Paenibacillus sp. IHBB 10380 TaxID=1566358 RepID=UPI000698E332|nr:polyprenyl synthetase family protein [Paenibacillus sp. IHBB 10380]